MRWLSLRFAVLASAILSVYGQMASATDDTHGSSPERGTGGPINLTAAQTVMAASPAAGPVQIVTLRSGADLDGFIREFEIKPRHVYRHALRGFAAAMSGKQMQKLAADSRVASVEPDALIVPYSQTNLPYGIVRMGVDRFPVAHIDGRDNRINVDIAIVDTGIQLDHVGLNVVGSVDCTGEGLAGYDHNGHGTEMAGVAAGIYTIGYSVGDTYDVAVGVAPGARLWSVQVIGTNGIGSWSDGIAGFDYVATNADRISVVNCSFGGNTDTNPSPYQAVEAAVSNLVSLGVVVVAAAGNSGIDIAGADGVYGTADDIIPAALPEVMAVTGMDELSDLEDAVALNFSAVPHTNGFVRSPGAGIDVAAAATSIFTTGRNSGYVYVGATSPAAAEVSGLVALYIAANGRATNASGVYRIRQAIIDNSLPQSQWMPNGYPYDALTNNTGDTDGYPEPLAMPSENWVPKPFITQASNSVAGFRLGFSAVPGYTYTVQDSDVLTLPVQWTNLSSIDGTGSVSTVTITDPAPDPTNRFYRLLRTPSP